MDLVVLPKIAKDPSIHTGGFCRNKLCRTIIATPATTPIVPFLLLRVGPIHTEKNSTISIVVIVIVVGVAQQFAFGYGGNLQGRIEPMKKFDQHFHEVGRFLVVLSQFVQGPPNVHGSQIIEVRQVIAIICFFFFFFIHYQHDFSDPGKGEVLDGFPYESRPNWPVDVNGGGSDQSVRSCSHGIYLSAISLFVIVVVVVFDNGCFGIIVLGFCFASITSTGHECSIPSCYCSAVVNRSACQRRRAAFPSKPWQSISIHHRHCLDPSQCQNDEEEDRYRHHHLPSTVVFVSTAKPTKEWVGIHKLVFDGFPFFCFLSLEWMRYKFCAMRLSFVQCMPCG